MSLPYDAEDVDEDIEEVEYEPSDEEVEELAEEPDLVAPSIYPGKEDLRTWNPDAAYGVKATTAEGAMGKKLRRAAKAARTPEERFRDNVERAASANNASVDRGTVNAMLKLIPLIPDISFKSPAGCLLGWLFRPYVGRKLTGADKTRADAILAKTAQIKDKHLQIGPIDVLRYGRAWNHWMTPTRQV